MEGIRKSLMAAAVLLGGLAVDAEAQPWRFDLGVNGGGSWLTPLLEEEELGADADVDLDAGWLTGAQATLWLGNRFGLRANFAYTNRGLAFDGDESLFGDNTDMVQDVNLWTGTGDLMVRFAEPRDRFAGFSMLPYLTIGAGARWTNPPGDRYALASSDEDLLDDNDRTGEPFTVAGETYFLEETAMPAFRAGLGVDARLSEHSAFRLEIGDVISETAIHRVDGTGPSYTSTDGNIGEMEHDLYATLGLHVLIGTARDRTVTAALSAPRPEDRPMQRHRTEPPAPSAGMQPVSICIADPARAPDGMLLVDAHYRPAHRDTVVHDGGRMVTIREWVGRTTFPTTDREDVTFVASANPIIYEPTGEPRPVEGLVYLGDVNGLPLYTAKSELRTLQGRLDETRAAEGLDEWLRRDPANARVFRSEVIRLYAPVERIGCVFRPLRQVGS